MKLHDKLKVGSEYFVKYLEDGEIKNTRVRCLFFGKNVDSEDIRLINLSDNSFGKGKYEKIEFNQILSASEIIFESKEADV